MAFLAGKPKDAVQVELFTITLLGGTVYRWTSADVPITYGGFTFTLGPRITAGTFKCSRGLTVDDLEINLADDGTTLVGGVPILQFLRQNGLNGASIKLEIGVGPSWSAPLVGTYIAFAGRYAELKDWGALNATITVNSWLDLLTQYSINPNVIQSNCRHVLGDAGCGVNLASFTSNGLVAAGAATTLAFPTNLTLAANYATYGTITFTSGLNAGQQRSVALQTGAGAISLILALPAVPMAGDAFSITAGCDLTTATCSGKFNNLLEFGGMPFVPPPELGY
jgi:uncharacterized phage protein (TIGR02218 family)